ncbi:MAG: hypothetical protein IH945_00195 [Armatimonadetes bacterium]|nr:hypothetical protein [Armatimonadota bacterium]
MIAALILGAIALQQDQQTLFERVIGQPTGRNGYEEYVAAADIAQRIDLWNTLKYIDSDDRQGTKLDAQRALARNMGRILSLIEQGSKKDVGYPKPMDFNTTLPELSQFRSISRALVHTAEVRLADGQPNVAMDILTQTVVFGDKVAGSGPMIFNLVGRVIAAAALQAVGKNVQYISTPSSRSVASACSALLEMESPFIRSLQWEFSAVSNGLDDLFANPEGLFGVNSGFAALLQNTSENEKTAAKQHIRFALQQQFQARIELLQSPESEWYKESRQIDELAVPTDPLAKAVFENLMPNLGRIDLYAMGRRTQLRLFRASAAVMDYRWNHGYYPGSLAQLPDQRIAYDPLTNGLFEYEITEAGFRIYSRGTEDTGPIDLFYTPPRSAAIKPD